MSALNIDPEKIYNKLYLAGTEWSSAHAKACLLEECQKSEFSTIVCEFLESCKSVAEAETRARADPRTKDYIKTMVEARRDANDYKVKYAAANTWFEALRSQASTLRQELKTLPGVK